MCNYHLLVVSYSPFCTLVVLLTPRSVAHSRKRLLVILFMLQTLSLKMSKLQVVVSVYSLHSCISKHEDPSGLPYQHYGEFFCCSLQYIEKYFLDRHTIATWRRSIYNQLLPLPGPTLLGFSWSQAILVGHSNITR